MHVINEDKESLFNLGNSRLLSELSKPIQLCIVGIKFAKPVYLVKPSRAGPIYFQHSVILTASPPNDVSLYLCDISNPVCFIASMQLSNDIKCLPSPLSAREAAV